MKKLRNGAASGSRSHKLSAKSPRNHVHKLILSPEQQEQLTLLGKWTRLALEEKRIRPIRHLIQDAFDFGLEQLLEINQVDAQCEK